MNYRQRPFPSTEFELVVECCRWAFARGDPAPVRELAQRARWSAVVALGRRHRVQGLIGCCIRTLEIPLPAEIAASIAGDAAAIAAHNLRAARQSKLLLKAFSEAGIPLIFVKGLTLGALAYSDPLVKMGWDADVLIGADRAGHAAAALDRLGYRLTLPAVAASSAAFVDWHRRRKESVWISPEGVHVELHTRLADSLEMIPSIGIGSPLQQVEVLPGHTLPTLARDELFAYLCVHGASSAWFRLKWITDLAALLDKCTAAEVERLYVRSQELGAGRAAAQALLLATRVYDIPLSPALTQRLNAERANRWLASAAWSQMVRDSEPTRAPLGTASIHLTQLLLRPGSAFKLTEAKRQISDWARPTR